MSKKTTTDLTVKQTAAAMRRALREAFPTAKLSVRMDAGTAHGWIAVQWQDGPTPEQVEDTLSPFQSAYFDAMDDTYRLIPQDGPVRYSCRGLSTHRSMSEAAARLMAERINTEDPTQPARAEGIRVEGGQISEEAAGRLQVVGFGCTEDGEATVDVDLAAHQIFSRTTFPMNSPANR